jgi:GT2 family glycosyltransferase
MKICVATPSTGVIKTETHLSILGTVYNTKHELYHVIWNSCYVHENRTILVNMARDEKCDAIFFVDSDMAFHNQTLNKLIAVDKPVVGADYNHRHFPLESTVKFADESGHLISKRKDEFPKVPFRCFGVATGCMLIKMDVFDKIDIPWFDFEYDEQGKVATGEDIFFCKQLYNKGIEVWCDPTVEIGHIGSYSY